MGVGTLPGSIFSCAIRSGPRCGRPSPVTMGFAERRRPSGDLPNCTSPSLLTGRTMRLDDLMDADVIVVGAGLAGLAATAELAAAGRAVLLLAQGPESG